MIEFKAWHDTLGRCYITQECIEKQKTAEPDYVYIEKDGKVFPVLDTLVFVNFATVKLMSACDFNPSN